MTVSAPTFAALLQEALRSMDDDQTLAEQIGLHAMNGDTEENIAELVQHFQTSLPMAMIAVRAVGFAIASCGLARHYPQLTIETIGNLSTTGATSRWKHVRDLIRNTIMPAIREASARKN